MIINLISSYHVLRDKYHLLRKQQKEFVFKYLIEHIPENNCFLCNCIIKTRNVNFTSIHQFINSKLENEITPFHIENMLCYKCLIRIHSKLPLFCLPVDCLRNIASQSEEISLIPTAYSESIKILKNYGILSKTTPIIYEYNISDIELLLINSIDNEQDMKTIKSICVQRMIKGYKEYEQRCNNKRLAKELILYKIDTIEEQLEIIKNNHSKALKDGNLEEAEPLQFVYYELFERKVKLKEQYSRI